MIPQDAPERTCRSVSAPHPPHLWVLARQRQQCPGVGEPSQDAPAGPVPGDRTKIADALAELVFVSRDGTHADWQQRPLKEQTERVIALISSAREEGRDSAADDIAAMVERRGCCGAPSICGATCQDSAEDDAITRGAKPLAALIRTWKIVDRARRSS